MGGQVIGTVKYAGELVLLAKEQTVLQGVFDSLIEIGRRDGTEMNVETSKVMRITKEPSPVQIMIDPKKNWRMWNTSTICVAR